MRKHVVVRICFFVFLLDSLVSSHVIAAPYTLSLNSAIQNRSFLGTANGDKKGLMFAVSTVKPNKTGAGWRLQFTLNGFTARNVTLRQVIQEAYGVYEENRLSEGPRWLTSDQFDIDAKIDQADVVRFGDLSIDQRRSALQMLLADRFKLRVHHQIVTMPGYALVIAKGGPKLTKTSPGEVYHSQINGIDGIVTRSERGVLGVEGFTMTGFARLLYQSAGLMVQDRTGLTDRYSFMLRWAPDEPQTVPANLNASGQQEIIEPNASEASIFTALREQLGLKLDAIKYPVDTIVIDQVEKPSAN